MERRKFLKLGGLFSAAATTTGVAAFSGDVKAKTEPLPKFESKTVLTSEALNAMVERINMLESRLS